MTFSSGVKELESYVCVRFSCICHWIENNWHTDWQISLNSSLCLHARCNWSNEEKKLWKKGRLARVWADLQCLFLVVYCGQKTKDKKRTHTPTSSTITTALFIRNMQTAGPNQPCWQTCCFVSPQATRVTWLPASCITPAPPSPRRRRRPPLTARWYQWKPTWRRSVVCWRIGKGFSPCFVFPNVSTFSDICSLTFLRVRWELSCGHAEYEAQPWDN